MKDLAFNVWHDLREKRLWPVALVLALALVAVPAVLLKGAPEKPPPPVAATGKGATVPLVASDPTAIAGSSKLGAFGSKDPFRSLAGRQRAAGAADAGATSADAGAAASGGLGGGDIGLDVGQGPGAGSTAAAGGSGGGGSGGGASGSSGSAAPSGGSGSGSGSSPAPNSGSRPPASEPPKPRYYAFAVDLSFGRLPRGVKDLRGIQAVYPLLSRNGNVVAVYLGQTPENESIFFVNPDFDVIKGCRTKCEFVKLRPESGKNEVIFRGRIRAGKDAGARYRLVLRAVRRVLDERKASESSNSSRAKRGAKAADASSRATRARRHTRFDFRVPMIAGRRR